MRCEDCIRSGQGFFNQLDSSELTKINQNKMLMKFEKGQPIFNQDEPSRGLFCVKSGKVKVTKSVGSKNAIIRIVTTGDIVGHYGVISAIPYTYSAIAVEDTLACFLDKNFMSKTLETSLPVSQIFLKKLCTERFLEDSRISIFLSSNSRSRIAQVLLDLAKKYGKKENDKISIGLKISREELAQMIGSVELTVIRLITDFKNEGLIEEHKRQFVIVNEEKLKTIAESIS